MGCAVAYSFLMTPRFMRIVEAAAWFVAGFEAHLLLHHYHHVGEPVKFIRPLVHTTGNPDRNPPKTRESPSLAREALSRGGRDLVEATFGPNCIDCNYFGCCCWSGVVVGVEEPLEANCSRSFFSRLISTRPPLMCFVLSFSSVLATGALPMPTR